MLASYFVRYIFLRVRTFFESAHLIYFIPIKMILPLNKYQILYFLFFFIGHLYQVKLFKPFIQFFMMSEMVHEGKICDDLFYLVDIVCKNPVFTGK